MGVPRNAVPYPKAYDLPDIDVLTYIFESEYSACQEETKLHIDAENTANFVTKARARELTKRIAHGLRFQHGIGKQRPGKDVVTGFLTGSYMMPMIFYGVIAAGGIYAGAGTGATAGDLARQMREGESKVVICSSDLKETAIKAMKLVGLPLSALLVLEVGTDPTLKAIDCGRSCISEEELEWGRVTDANELKKRVVCLVYSSGTTGMPKGVCVSHLNFVSQSLLPLLMLRQYRSHMGQEPYEFRTLAHLPVAHIAGCQSYCINAPANGGETYWMKGFDWLKFLEYNKKHRITNMLTVPPIYLLIAKSPGVTDQFDHLEQALTAAAPMGRDLQLLASRKLGKGRCVIQQTYGLSETTGSCTLPPKDWEDETGSVSAPAPNMQIMLLDDDGHEIEASSRKSGEIIVKGPVVTQGYFKNEQSTRDAFFGDGWLKTGDVGYMRDGLLYIVDRKKELIKYKGNQVAPAELEALLLAHPLIADAAVIGVHGEATELPRAYVVPAAPSSNQKQISATEIQKFVEEQVASHKRLRGGVIFLDAIPKSPSGKILRRELRELATKESRARL